MFTESSFESDGGGTEQEDLVVKTPLSGFGFHHIFTKIAFLGNHITYWRVINFDTHPWAWGGHDPLTFLPWTNFRLELAIIYWIDHKIGFFWVVISPRGLTFTFWSWSKKAQSTSLHILPLSRIRRWRRWFFLIKNLCLIIPLLVSLLFCDFLVLLSIFLKKNN